MHSNFSENNLCKASLEKMMERKSCVLLFKLDYFSLFLCAGLVAILDLKMAAKYIFRSIINLDLIVIKRQTWCLNRHNWGQRIH